MLSRKNICGLAIPKFLAGFGNEKELVAASAHQPPKAFFRAPVSRRGVEQVDAAFERKVEQKFDVVIFGEGKTSATRILQPSVPSKLDSAEAKWAHFPPCEPWLAKDGGAVTISNH